MQGEGGQGDGRRDPERDRISSARRKARALQGEGPRGLRPGAVLGGRYELVGELGRGGMGVVWQAHDTALDEPVALKFLPRELASDEQAVRELRDEAKVMLSLTHPNIVRLRDIRFFASGAFLVVEYMAGGGLDRLQRERQATLTAPEALWVLHELVPAMAFAHANGVTHRDIKPANLLLSEPISGGVSQSGVALKLSDFGLAFTAKQALSRSTGYRPSGTLEFMAPEVLLGRMPTPAADTYSLAATIYALVAGKPPFWGGDVATRILEEEAPALQSGWPPLDDAVGMALAKDPEQRPVSVEEFLELADGAREVVPRRRWGVGVAVSAIGLALATGAFFALRSAGRPAGAEETVAAVPLAPAETPVTRVESPPDPAPREPARAEVAEDRPPAAPPTEPPAEQSSLAALHRSIAEAPDVEAALRWVAASAAVEPDECEAACRQAIPVLRGELALFELPPDASPAGWMAAVAEAEEVVGRFPCAASLGAEVVKDLELPAVALADPPAEEVVEWLVGIDRHRARGHDCPVAGELDEVHTSACALLRLRATAALREDRPETLFELATKLEELGPSAGLVLVEDEGVAADLSRQACTGASAAAWNGSVAEHRREAHECVVPGVVRVADDLALEEAVEAAFTGVATSGELFGALATLEPLPRVGAPEWIARVRARVEDVLAAAPPRGLKNATTYVVEAMDYVASRPDTVLGPAIEPVVGAALPVLDEWLDRTSSLKRAASLATDLRDREVPEPIGAMLEGLFRRLDGLVAAALRKADAKELQAEKDGRPSILDQAANEYRDVAQALEDCPVYAPEYRTALWRQGRCQLELARVKNEGWRAKNVKDSPVRRKWYRLALECFLELEALPEATREERADAVQGIVAVYVRQAEDDIVLCERNFKDFVPRREWRGRALPWRSWEHFVPAEQFEGAEEGLRQAERWCRELGRGGECGEIARLQARLDAVRDPDELKGGRGRPR